MPPRHGPPELTLSASKDEALQAILAALPKDAVVRAEDDGVGRFAGQRTVAIIGRNDDRVLLFEGTWGTLKPRLDDPQLEVAFEERDGAGTVARIRREAPQPKSSGTAVVGDLLNRGLTVAVLVVGYFWVRSQPIDVQLTVTISVLGGLAWTVIAFLMPKKEDRGLEGRIRDALAPLTVEDEPSEVADADAGAET